MFRLALFCSCVCGGFVPSPERLWLELMEVGIEKTEVPLGGVLIMIELTVHGEIPMAFASLTCFLFALLHFRFYFTTYVLHCLALFS